MVPIPISSECVQPHVEGFSSLMSKETKINNFNESFPCKLKTKEAMNLI